MTEKRPAASSAAPAVEPFVLERCLATLRHTPAGLVTDIDGTISAIAATPSQATVSARARATLAELAGRLAFVGVVTGRSAANAETMVGVPGIAYIGNHGMERLQNGEGWEHPAALANADAIGAALREVRAEATTTGLVPYLVVEDKRLSGSIHYRLAPDQERAAALLVPIVGAAAGRHGLVMTEGRMVLELRPRVLVNKGTAVMDLVAERALKGLVFLGDDLTDVDAFRAVRTLREAGRVAGLSVGVVAPETHPDVLGASDVTVDGVATCVELLAAVAAALS